jgi:hypothetical protein
MLPAFASATSVTEFVEEGSRITTYTMKRRPVLDFGYGVEAGRGVFVATAISWVHGSSDADLNIETPHPFYFDKPRTLSANVKSLPRDEIGVHFQAAGVVSVNRWLHLVVGAGPSVFRLKQTLVNGVLYDEEYPYDTVRFGSATTEPVTKVWWGGNAQLNIVTMFHRNAGVDAFVRYSRASVPFTGTDNATFNVQAGGLHIGVGVRGEF